MYFPSSFSFSLITSHWSLFQSTFSYHVSFAYSRHKYKVIERPNVCYIFIGTMWIQRKQIRIQRKRIRIQKTTDPDPKDNGSGSNDNEYGSTDNGSDKTGLNTTKDICIVHRVNFRKFPNWRESLPIQRFSLHISVLTWAFGVKILFWQCPFESGLCILWASLCF